MSVNPGDGQGPPGGQPPRSLIVTIYGLYARPDGWLTVSSLITLMAQVGVDEPAVRSAISRLKRRGLLDAQRAHGVARYALSEQARQILEAGDRRIYGRRRALTDDGWVLVVFSVPESERTMRHRLRSRLSWLGFGVVGPGVWIAPGHLMDDTRDALVRDDLLQYADIFHVTHRDGGQDVASWWDLDALGRLYEDFDAAFRPTLQTWRRRRTIDPSEAFADYVRMFTSWRRLPFLDPGLPTELLPKGWPGYGAEDVYAGLTERLAGPAQEYVELLTRSLATTAV